MRKITTEAVAAFMGGYRFSKSNMLVATDMSDEGVVRMFLHGNEIARRTSAGTFITDAGWSSNTTKERLNGIPGVSISQKNWNWYLNGALWDGAWTKI